MKLPRESMDARLQRLQYLNGGLVLGLVAVCTGTLYESLQARIANRVAANRVTYQSIPSTIAVKPNRTAALTNTPAQIMPSPRTPRLYYHKVVHRPHVYKRVHHTKHHRYSVEYGPISFHWDDAGDD